MITPAKNPEGVSAEELALAALMDAYLSGQLEAFDGIYAALSGRLRGYLCSLCRNASVADDLLQDTFLQMHRSRHTYEPGRPVTPWVFAIARHVYLMHRRGTARRLRFEDSLAVEVARMPAIADDASAFVRRDEVERALETVPSDQRDAVVMHHIEGWSFAEIAARCGIKVNAAKTRAFRGIRHLREQMVRR